MKAFVIVQARMGSSRFPGKSLALLEGRPILWHLFRQLSFCRRVERRILATTDRAPDDALAAYAEGEGWDVFRGEEDDVLARYRGAALAFGATAETPIVRCTGDDIWPDPGLLDALVDIYEGLGGRIDCVCTDRSDRMPYGADLELWPFRALDRAWREADDPYDREHVSPYILRDPVRFPRIELVSSIKLPGISLSIDRPEDLARNARLLARLKTMTEPPYRLSHILDASARMREAGEEVA
jgi:spore coat polysaccharide biosynthesis protein SpsF (cytidylyltransferase family)